MLTAPPNILYLVCHDIGKHLGCYGAIVDTPRIDAFAAEGVRFTQAFTNAVACTPSRACAMSGLYAHTSGCIGLSHMGWPLDLRHRTTVDFLNDAGYETILSGVNHERHPRADRYAVDVTKTWDDWDAARAVDNALAYLRTRDRSRPFYCNVGAAQPHLSSWSQTEERYGGPVPPEDVWLPPYCPDNGVLRRQFGRFQAAIGYLDRHFGRLLDGLREMGHNRDTIVVFTTDHGISCNRSKGTLYDRGAEIALLVRLPDGRLAGTRVDHLVQNIDLPPTLAEAAGAPVPGHLQGRSFWPLLSGGTYRPHEVIFTERNFHGEYVARGADEFQDEFDPVRAARTADFHYIRWFRPGVKPRPLLPHEVPAGWVGEGERLEMAWPVSNEPRAAEELYHVTHDPQEFVNVAPRPEYRHVLARLRGDLEKWMRDTGDFASSGTVPVRPEESGWGPNWPVDR